MEALSQLDVTAPDHVSVITRDGKVTISVLKDGTSVTLGFPIKTQWIDTHPRPPLQQSPAEEIGRRITKEEGLAYLEELARKDSKNTTVVTKAKRRSPIGNCKLTPESVREIKLILADNKTMSRFGSRQQAYEKIAEGYSVSHHTISNIHKGLAWRQVIV